MIRVFSILLSGSLIFSSMFNFDRNVNKPLLRSEFNKSIIIDTDLGLDIDDATGLRIATELHDKNTISIKAICSSTSLPDVVDAIDGLLTHDKVEDDIIIGTCSTTTNLDDTYLDVMTPYKSNRYTVLDSVSAYRKILSESSSFVDIVTTGYLYNIEALLKSTADEYSELNGIDLVREKVGQLYVVGGSYPEGKDNNFYASEGSSEAAWYVNENFPLPIIYIINNQANTCICGAELQQVDTDKKDIITQALYRYGVTEGYTAWDPYGILLASYGINPICNSNIKRANAVIDKETGYNEFELDKDGRHYVVFRNKIGSDEYYNKLFDTILLRKFYSLYGDK